MRACTGDYLLSVDKPVGPTSHDIVAAARRALGCRRIGHTGTLDPFASGLLVLCVGRATRLAEYLSGMDKRYVAGARLGVATDTLDSDGEVVSTTESWRSLDEGTIASGLQALRGSIDQVPPQFSAKKVDGEAMHRRARRGERVDLAPVPVTVYDIELLAAELPHVRFSVRCSSGTYVRAIARDLGEALGVGAHLTELRRTAVGDFSVEDAVALEELDDAEVVGAARVEPVRAVGHMASVEVDTGVAARLRNGQRVRIAAAEERGADGALVAVVVAEDLLAIAELDDGVLRPRKVFPA